MLAVLWYEVSLLGEAELGVGGVGPEAGVSDQPIHGGITVEVCHLDDGGGLPGGENETVVVHVLETVEMDPVPLACLPEEVIRGLHRSGHLKIGLHENAEVHQLGDGPGVQIDGEEAILYPLISSLLGQGQHLAIGAEADIVVEVIARKVIDLGDPAQTVDPGQLGGGDTGDDLVPVEEDAVQAEALQHHLIAENAGVIIEKAIAQVAVDPHHGKETIRLSLIGGPFGHLQAGVIAGAGVRHVHLEAHQLPGVAQSAGDGHGHVVGLAGDQPDELELVDLCVRLTGAVGSRCGKVGYVLVIHMYGVGDLCGLLCLKVEIESIAAGTKGVEHRQRHAGGPGGVGHGFQALERAVQPLLHRAVIEGEVLLADVLGDQLDSPEAVTQLSLGEVHLPLGALGDDVSGLEGPVGAHHVLLGGESLGDLHHNQGHGDDEDHCDEEEDQADLFQSFGSHEDVSLSPWKLF